MKLTLFVAGDCHLYQMDLPPRMPPWTGSLGSSVALMFVPLTVPLSPAIAWAFAKSSFGGRTIGVGVGVATGAPTLQLKTTVPVTPSFESIAM